MAAVRKFQTQAGEVIEVRGRYRTITVQASGDGYTLSQYAHIDESGVRKLRSWGWAPDQVAAVEKAAGHSERQHG